MGMTSTERANCSLSGNINFGSNNVYRSFVITVWKNGVEFLFPVPRGELLVFHTVVGVLEPVETSLIIACLFCCIHENVRRSIHCNDLRITPVHRCSVLMMYSWNYYYDSLDNAWRKRDYESEWVRINKMDNFVRGVVHKTIVLLPTKHEHFRDVCTLVNHDTLFHGMGIYGAEFRGIHRF